MKLILLWLLLLGISTLGIAQSKLPPYKKVVKELHKRLDIYLELDKNQRIHVSKRLDAYWVSLLSYDAEQKRYQNSQSQVFWTEKEGYQNVQIAGDQEKALEISLSSVISNKPYFDEQQDYYNIFPCYGYSNWYHDAIKHYKKQRNKRQLTIEERYSLARTHLILARNTLTQTGDYVPFFEHKDYRKATENDISNKRQKIYHNNYRKALQLFLSIYEEQEDFPTKIGNIYTKYSNELMEYHRTVDLFGFEPHPDFDLINYDLYNPALLDYAANQLNSCPEKAILVTYGDNNYYTIRYLQERKYLRRDVLVVSCSSLNDWQTLEFLKYTGTYGNKLPLDIPLELFKGIANSAIYVGEGDHTVGKEDFIQFLTEQSKKGVYEKDTFRYKTFTLPLGNSLLSISPDETTEVLSKDQWIFWIMLLSNEERRPICCVSFLSSYNSKFLNPLQLKDYLHLQGFVYRLEPREPQDDDVANLERNQQLFENDLGWSSDQPVNLKDINIPIAYHWTYVVWHYGRLLMANQKKKEVCSLMDDYLQIYPTEALTVHDFIFVDMVNWYLLHDKYTHRPQVNQLVQAVLKPLLKKDSLSERNLMLVNNIKLTLNYHGIKDYEHIIRELEEKPEEIKG